MKGFSETTVSATAAFERQLKALCIEEFPCGFGTWVSFKHFKLIHEVYLFFTSINASIISRRQCPVIKIRSTKNLRACTSF